MAELQPTEFTETASKYFITTLSDGTEVELVGNGNSVQVTEKNVTEYVDLVVERRLNEAKLQMEWIVNGIKWIVEIPSLLNMFSWKELREKV